MTFFSLAVKYYLANSVSLEKKGKAEHPQSPQQYSWHIHGS